MMINTSSLDIPTNLSSSFNNLTPLMMSPMTPVITKSSGDIGIKKEQNNFHFPHRNQTVTSLPCEEVKDPRYAKHSELYLSETLSLHSYHNQETCPDILRNGNIPQSTTQSARTSNCFPVLFASDDEEFNPFLSPTSTQSSRVINNNDHSNLANHKTGGNDKPKLPILHQLSLENGSGAMVHSMVLVGDKMSLQQSTQTSFDNNEHSFPVANNSKAKDVSITVNPMDISEKSRKSGVASLTAIPGSGFLNKIELELEEQAAATNDISQLTQNNIDTKRMSRRLSDISCHIDELRREISGLSHLASELYTVTQNNDPDKISLDSIHNRVLLRCTTKYQQDETEKSRTAARCFVIMTSILILVGITYSFWLKNFSSYSQYFH